MWRHLRAILLLPALATLIVPAALLYLTRSVRVGWGLPGPLAVAPIFVAGGLIAAGLGLFAWTVRAFAVVGQGTLAPWDPPRRFVASGVYRYVRNPMITGVICILLGEAALVGSLPLLGWAGAFLLANAVYIPFVEERDLERRFGEDYRAYQRQVPRWVPRRPVS
ncbi:MAG: isoprenylcysteine carboxylmethyltransferase family protein, partial [Dehalococcoidia bacterium]|nr:isoprenylcysteine carboxylmethyltransferase family protein [Dehalococcoidia bacterium]